MESSELGPIRDLSRYKVGTVWFGIQEFRQQAYIRWTEILNEHDLDLVLDPPEGDSPQTPECIGEETYGPDATYVQQLGFEFGSTPEEVYQLGLGRSLHYVFKAKQRFGIFSELGLDAEACWEEFSPMVAKDINAAYEDARRIFNSLYRITPEQRARLGLTFELGVSGDIEELQDLVKSAMRSLTSRGANPQLLCTRRVDSILVCGTASQFADRLPIERQLWVQDTAENSRQYFKRKNEAMSRIVV